jgi:hypothetical protein
VLRNRFLIFLGVSFLAASAALADDVGFIDCSSHSEGTQVFGKPRKSPDVVATVPCGERFTILLYGFVFSRIQTSDGKVGYVYSNMIAVDRNATVVQKQAPATVVTASEKVAVPRTPAANPAPPAAAQPQPAPAQPASAPETAAAVTSASPSTSQATVAAAPSASASPATPAPPASIAAAQSAPATHTSAPAPLEAAPNQLAPMPVNAPATPAASESAAPAAAPSAPVAVAAAPAANVPDAAPASAPPDPQPAAQPDPAPAAPPAPVRPANATASWERPTVGARRSSRVEVFGGYAFARIGGGGTFTNFNGVLGSFGLNVKPWLQIVADTSYSMVNISNTKNVIYGNHYGPRYFHRSRLRWGATPFAEALFGASRADTTISGVGGYSISQNSFSYKLGGGLDLHPSSHWEVRLFDVDYYRTSFGTNVHQNSYWASAGIVLRLFGGATDY